MPNASPPRPCPPEISRVYEPPVHSRLETCDKELDDDDPLLNSLHPLDHLHVHLQLLMFTRRIPRCSSPDPIQPVLAQASPSSLFPLELELLLLHLQFRTLTGNKILVLSI